jgi:hypothetical protein
MESRRKETTAKGGGSEVDRLLDLAVHARTSDDRIAALRAVNRMAARDSSAARRLAEIKRSSPFESTKGAYASDALKFADVVQAPPQPWQTQQVGEKRAALMANGTYYRVSSIEALIIVTLGTQRIPRPRSPTDIVGYLTGFHTTQVPALATRVTKGLRMLLGDARVVKDEKHRYALSGKGDAIFNALQNSDVLPDLLERERWAFEKHVGHLNWTRLLPPSVP